MISPLPPSVDKAKSTENEPHVEEQSRRKEIEEKKNTQEIKETNFRHIIIYY